MKLRPFSKLKKQIENLFIPELKIKVMANRFDMPRGSSSIPRFYVKMGKDIICDLPKDLNIEHEYIFYWAGDNNISNTIRNYIDTPLDQLLEAKFENSILTDIFKSSDRRIGKEKLLSWQKEVNNPTVDKVLTERFSKKLSKNEQKDADAKQKVKDFAKKFSKQYKDILTKLAYE